ncbi:putative ABC transport system permease protein [Alkalispirochaeta americana]|uniref:Putative ABC transport system permease protein n=1 Tax=Alkalispirochaeta americana TaxID=159291 RepID=A0A1N6T1M5_9SPIO|nr:iron export ABC transporter permease subunit FetB [Alkalispirochaeta americana]SIQ47298.1 putative ABC transport system permease protein [Alkalispirochaeta americana]
MTGAAEISLPRLALSYVLVLGVLVLAGRLGHRSRRVEIFLATLRMTVQLVAAGYILEMLFAKPSWVFTLLVFLIMEGFAVGNIFSRVGVPLSPELRRVITAGLCAGTVTVVIFFMVLILGVDPWYAPRYFIPIAGMLVGNAMTGITLGVERLVTGISSNAERIEGALMLGASPGAAGQRYAREAFGAALVPTINSMVGMGIVFLPGMMTGQILSGSAPAQAIRYQIAIMLGILASVAITVYVVTDAGYRTFFTADKRLVIYSGTSAEDGWRRRSNEQ